MDEKLRRCSFCLQTKQPLREVSRHVFLCQCCEAYTHQVPGTEFAHGSIGTLKSEGAVLQCEVLLDDGRLIEAMVPADQYLPGPPPVLSDRVRVLVVRSQVSVVVELTRAGAKG